MYICSVLYQALIITNHNPTLFLPQSLSELATRKYLDKYLANALNLSLEDGRLKAVDSQEYVLTLDYTLKVVT